MTTVKSLSREMKFFLLALIPIYFISVGLIIQPFDSIVTGIYEIIWEPDFLITDYIAVGGMGAAFVNAGMMALISIYFVYSLGMEMDGHTITSCCLMFGFSLFGKNLMNIWAIFLGVFLYAKYHKMHLSNYIYVGIYSDHHTADARGGAADLAALLCDDSGGNLYRIRASTARDAFPLCP